MIALMAAQAVAAMQPSAPGLPSVPAPVVVTDVPVVPAGRADENAVRQAGDAFGTTIGRETIGIYSAGSVRGFSPVAAGNARIEGLYFDQISSPNTRIRRSTSIKVGLSSQGYLFPAPTGVVDYALRRPGQAPLVSGTFSASEWGGVSAELDAELPVIGDTLSVGIGLGGFANQFANGANSYQHIEGLTARWRPAPGVEILPFWGRTTFIDDEIGPLLSPAGAFLPPRIQRRRYFGAKWMDYNGRLESFGTVAAAGIARGWTIEAGLFRSSSSAKSDIFTFLDDITEDGRARFIAFSDPPFRRASTSGELRIRHDIVEGPRAHRVALSLRGRQRRDRIGGSAFLDFGPVRLGAPLVFAEPPIAYGPQARDRVRQWTGGLAYVGRWRDVGEISAGLSRTDYAKRFDRPGQALTSTRDRRWIWNMAGAAYLSGRLALYGGYTRGLEETGLPPQNATNRNQALPAIGTSQRDAGLRWNFAGDLKLVAGVFDVRKPYLSLDPAGLFTTLGSTRHRGVEASLSGTAFPGMSIAFGAVLLDPRVTGEARRLGRVGRRPVGVPLRSIDLNIDYRFPGFEALSLDAALSGQGRVASTVDNTLSIPSRATVDIGARYRFRIGAAKATLRVAVGNLLDKYAYSYNGPGTFDFIDGRQLNGYLAIDL